LRNCLRKKRKKLNIDFGRLSEEVIVPIYRQTLSEADLDALIEFYRSPAGRAHADDPPLNLPPAGGRRLWSAAALAAAFTLRAAAQLPLKLRNRAAASF